LSLSRACADGCWPDGNRDGNDDGQVDRCTRAQGQHESALLSRQPRVCEASVLWIGLWMLSANRLVKRCEAVDEQGCGKVDNREDASLALGQEASAVHKRNEVSTVQPVSSVMPATGMLADLPFFRCSRCPGRRPCRSVEGCRTCASGQGWVSSLPSRLPSGAGLAEDGTGGRSGLHYRRSHHAQFDYVERRASS